MFARFLVVRWLVVWAAFGAASSMNELAVAADNGTLELHPRSRVETAPGSGRYHAVTREATWNAGETALIVCDMWDAHHCLNAVRREGELISRMNAVLAEARRQGALVIHAPSSCMAPYENHPARRRAKSAPTASNLPTDIGQWCRHIPEEDKGRYPIDQTDGGEDDDLDEHRQWHAYLASIGRNPKSPWKAQHPDLKIEDRDAISDSGVEIWNLLDQRGIKNVMLMGVHTNMCVLGRPFGLGQMSKNGRNVVLVRDLTDTMYNPAQWPFVSHYTGTDLIVEHIEKFVCPSITSVDLVGGEELRFSGDRRPHLAMVVAEDEYKTEESLPAFAARYLGRDFKVSFIFGNEKDRNDLPGIHTLDQADALLVSVRRRTLPKLQLDHVRKFISSGKPVIGIRTASHAFAGSKGKELASGQDQWLDFDPAVLGGSYVGHHGDGVAVALTASEGAARHPLLKGVELQGFVGRGSLYKVNPLHPGTMPILAGTIPNQPVEPVAWTRIRADGGRSFYTSLGHVGDFAQPAFCRLLANGIYWASGRNVPDELVVYDAVPTAAK